MEEKTFNYKEAMARIEDIAHKIEHEEPDIDELSALIKTAVDLIGQCKQKLRKTEEDLDNILNQIDNDE
jgi:exodeoxyribonuclease VII small subunit